MSDHVEGYAEPGHDGLWCQRINYLMDGFFAHTPHNAKLFSNGQANSSALRQFCWQGIMRSMEKTPDTPRPYSDIAERLKWHRNLLGMKQDEYAKSIGAKRSALSLWEAGTHRMSLNAALDLRNKYGLSLDFMYEGIDDALPMTLRNAWRDKP
ncbi:helix-turn-helix transcriptional regulator [Sulfitobacter sp. 1A12157]|uniref:helix-turn-helix transcriptional regulator n=1 Tax=Sulfitobacter sp. 1A12157 TaxID=3368594 RepID=UPI00374567A9